MVGLLGRLEEKRQEPDDGSDVRRFVRILREVRGKVNSGGELRIQES